MFFGGIRSDTIVLRTASALFYYTRNNVAKDIASIAEGFFNVSHFQSCLRRRLTPSHFHGIVINICRYGDIIRRPSGQGEIPDRR